MLRAASCAVAALLTATGLASAETQVRYAHMNSPGHFVNVEGQAMADAIASRTGGELAIEMFPSGQLGENSQISEQIILGGDLIGQVGPGTIADYVPDIEIVSYPFLYRDWSDAQRLVSSDLFAEIRAQAAERANVHILCFFAFGIRDLYTREVEVNSAADTEGLKMRVQPVTVFTEMVKQVFGAAPTPMPWPEVYSALSQGVIDAAEAPPSAILDQKHQEHAKYLVQTNHMLDVSQIITSASLFNRLSEEHQAIFQEEADAACDRMSTTALSGYEAGIEELRESGMTIISDFDRESFVERADGIVEAFPNWSEGLYDRARAAIEGN